MTNRMLINGVEGGPATPISGTLTLRFETDSGQQMSLPAVFISGLTATHAETFYKYVRGRFDSVEPWCEIDFDSSLFPNGHHSIYASIHPAAVDVMVAEFRAEIDIHNDNRPMPTKEVEIDVPHFSRKGKIIKRYDPLVSFIPRGMFEADVREFARQPELLRQYIDAGFNTLVSGVVLNTHRDIPNCTQQQFEDAQKPLIDQIEEMCKEHKLVCIANCMDWGGSPEYVAQMLSQPWSADAIRNTLDRMLATGVFICAEMCDETTWRFQQSGLPDVRRFTEILRSNPNGFPITWESGSMAFPRERLKRWEQGLYISDFVSIGTSVIDRYFTYDPSVDVSYRAMKFCTDGIRLDCPFTINVHCTGLTVGNPSEYERYNQAEYNALSMMGYGLVVGATAFKAYKMDTLWMKYLRSQGLGELGCDPETLPLRWQAMSHANHAIEELTPLLLQPRSECKGGGRLFATASWAGKRGKLWLAVSRLNAQQTASIPDGYTAGFTLGLDGRSSIDLSQNRVEVPAGGWVVLTKFEPVPIESNAGVLDSLPEGSFGISSRRLLTDYAGPIWKVQRTIPDTAEMDISALPNGDLDAAALLDFCGTGDGFCIGQYIQGGNGGYFASPHPPRVVHNGVLETANGKPCLNWISGTRGSVYDGPITIGHVVVVSASSIDQFTNDYETLASGGSELLLAGFGGGTVLFDDPSRGKISNNGIPTTEYAPLSELKITEMTFAPREFAKLQIGTDRVYGRYWKGPISEVLWFPSELSTDEKIAMRANQAKYFGITLP